MPCCCQTAESCCNAATVLHTPLSIVLVLLCVFVGGCMDTPATSLNVGSAPCVSVRPIGAAGRPSSCFIGMHACRIVPSVVSCSGSCLYPTYQLPRLFVTQLHACRRSWPARRRPCSVHAPRSRGRMHGELLPEFTPNFTPSYSCGVVPLCG